MRWCSWEDNDADKAIKRTGNKGEKSALVYELKRA